MTQPALLTSLFPPPAQDRHPPRPTHVYIFRAPCGCCLALANVPREDESKAEKKFAARFIAEQIENGLAVEKVTWDDYRERVSKEPTFMKCPHGHKDDGR